MHNYAVHALINYIRNKAIVIRKNVEYFLITKIAALKISPLERAVGKFIFHIC